MRTFLRARVTSTVSCVFIRASEMTQTSGSTKAE